jgi:hypothetical protein
MRRFRSAGDAQRFLSVFGIITSFFRVGRHLYRANGYREVMKTRFAVWEEVIGDQLARIIHEEVIREQEPGISWLA